MNLQSVRGTQDFLPEAQAKHNLVVDIARSVVGRFGFYEMATPIFEFSEVFKRTLGEASDIVSKEMYTFKDRNDEELTLRPEGTAGIARAFISEGLSQRTPLKVMYQGPMFRYERPQKGRYRQFHQLGIELLGPASGMADVECIAAGFMVLNELKIAESCSLEINSIGDEESRRNYIAALVKYLKGVQDQLSADSQKRLEQNPLRILDSKDEKDQALLKSAPLINEFYNEESKRSYAQIISALKAMSIPFNENPLLVRGLDYYSHCVFEFRTQQLGAQDAVLSGGRYDQLIKTMGGPATPGVGWAAGLERLSMLCPLEAKPARPVAILPIHESTEQEAFKLAYELRSKGLPCEVHFSGNMSKRMKKAVAQNCFAAVILGPDEIQKGEASVKFLDQGEQKSIRLTDLFSALRS